MNDFKVVGISRIDEWRWSFIVDMNGRRVETGTLFPGLMCAVEPIQVIGLMLSEAKMVMFRAGLKDIPV